MFTFSILLKVNVSIGSLPLKASSLCIRKLNLPKVDFAFLIRELKKLRYWPDSAIEFDFEEVEGAFEVKFTVDNRWIRVFAYKDDDQKKMYIIVVLAKKTNSRSFWRRYQ